MSSHMKILDLSTIDHNDISQAITVMIYPAQATSRRAGTIDKGTNATVLGERDSHHSRWLVLATLLWATTQTQDSQLSRTLVVKTLGLRALCHTGVRLGDPQALTKSSENVILHIENGHPLLHLTNAEPLIPMGRIPLCRSDRP
ncbi:unnamed protein product [Arabis nemorensis]|uniref:Uncharacterized protein n=1 Tax=Arabis nemorensis TaxID=586526 RepID=A0A565B260_9BRAS|nr:unnamed protein product [Arabis nemorensis]